MINILNKVYNKKFENNAEKTSILFGIFKKKYYPKRYCMEFRVLGIILFRSKVNKGIKKYFLLGLPVWFTNTRFELYQRVLDTLPKKYDNIYVNYNCSGETYLSLAYLKPLKNSVFIATKKYHVDLCHMMHPEVDCFYIPELLPLRGIDNIYKENYKNVNFYNILPFQHFINLESSMRKNLPIHYCEAICNTIGIDINANATSPIISESIKHSALQKAKRISLNLDNFIFLCPESQSNISPSTTFWKKLVDELYAKNYDVFINMLELKDEYGIGKTCFLTFEEAYYLASLSKCIIGLRSGFIEPLTSIKNLPIFCLYTDFKDRGLLKSISSDVVMKSFSLKKLPNVLIKNIFEYNILHISDAQEFANDILSKLSN